MSLQAADFETARATFKPMKRSEMKRRRPIKSSAIPYGTNSVSRKKKAKKKKETDGSLKKKVWKQFSIFIRTRGADEEGMQRCYTCDVKAHWKTLEAGHLVPGRTNSVLFDERSVWPQCRRCNGHFRGNTIVYYPKMVGMFGQAVVDEIVRQRDVTHKWMPGELAELLERYRSLNAANPLTAKELS